MDADAESDLGPSPHETFTRLETVFRSIFKNVKTISLKVLRGMRSEMLVDTLLTFSTIQKNNIPMFCSIFYSLWPSEKLGGTHSGGGRGRRDSPVICGADRALSVVIVLTSPFIMQATRQQSICMYSSVSRILKAKNLILFEF